MTEATEQVDAKQVSKAKVLVTQRAQDMDLLAQRNAEPSLFNEGAATALKTRIAAASKELDSFPPAVRVKAMTPGQLNDLVSSEMAKEVAAWYPVAFAAACKKLDISEQAIASKDAGMHSVSILGHYIHGTERFVKRPQLSKIVTISRKGLK